MSGPKEHLKKGWKMPRQHLNIEPERPLGLYLGCVHEEEAIRLPNGKMAIAVRYNMESYLQNTAKRFVKMAGEGTTLKFAATPFLVEDHKESPQGGSPEGQFQECPWRKHTFPPARTFTI